MNIYLVQPPDGFGGWDKYDVMIVAAPNEEEAVKLHPLQEKYKDCLEFTHPWANLNIPWFPEEPTNTLKVTFLGVTDVFSEPTVIFSSYNAG